MNTEELKIIISAEIDKLRKDLADAKKETEQFAKKSKSGLAGFNDGVKKANEVASKAFAAIALSVAGAATALLALAGKSEEYRVSQAQLATAFETAGGSAEQAKVVYEDLYRVLGDNGQATEAAQHLAQLTTNEKDLAEWTDICQGVYATFGASLPIESLTEAANETAKTGELTGALTDALNWAGVAEDDFKASLLECNTEAEREALIRSTLSGLYSEAAAGYEKNAESVLKQREAEVKLNEAMAQLGEVMAPIQAMLAEFGAQILTEISPAIQGLATKHGPQLKKALGDVVKALGDVIGWIADNWDLISTLGTVILAIVAALKAYSIVMGVVNAVMAASPITWIIAAIAALIAIIVLCVQHWDEIKAAGAKAWEAIKNAWNSVANWFNNTVIKPVVNFFSNMWNGLKNGASKAWDGIKSVFSSVANFFSDIFGKAWNGVKNIFSKGGKVFEGIKDGISSAFKTIVNGLISGINAVVAVPFKAINAVLNRLRSIDILGVKPFGWLGTINVPQIPKLAKGGIVDGATLALVGEQGREAVMPLENNTEWIDTLANRIAGTLNEGGNRPIVLQVDGKTFAQIAVKSINNLTRQQGKLSLNLV